MAALRSLTPEPAPRPVTYRCHECGNALATIGPRKLLLCRHCHKWRRVPTHPALIHRSDAQAHNREHR